MKNNSILCFFLFLSVFSLICDVGFCFFPWRQGKLRAFGGLQNKLPSNGDVDGIGRFAIEEHNKNTNAMLQFTRVVKAEEQVVSGKIYYLTLEALQNGKTETYEASVWVKPWLNFKQLQGFKKLQGV